VVCLLERRRLPYPTLTSTLRRGRLHARRRRGSMGRKVLWGVVGYGVTTLGTLLTTYLTELHISSLLGSILATTVGLVVVIIGVFIDAAKDGGGAATGRCPNCSHSRAEGSAALRASSVCSPSSSCRAATVGLRWRTACSTSVTRRSTPSTSRPPRRGRR